MHKGLYKYNTLYFGRKVTTAIFHQVADVMLTDYHFAIPSPDDELIKSKSRNRRIEHIKFVFISIRIIVSHLVKRNIIFLPKIKCLNQFIDKSGRHPDSLRVDQEYDFFNEYTGITSFSCPCKLLSSVHSKDKEIISIIERFTKKKKVHGIGQ